MIDLNTNEIVLLVLSGVLVGIINTLGGGGSVITMSLFMAMNMPIGIANGTNRIAVLLQNLSATVAFLRKGMLHLKSGLLLSLPAILGNILGAIVATDVSDTVFKVCLSVVLVIILIYLALGKDKEQVTGGHGLCIKWWHYLLFFIIGFYGGYIYIGLGFLILAIAIWTMNLDIVTANVIKGFVIFLSTPFALAVFIYNDQIWWEHGLLHAAGNIVGALLASHWAMSWGVKFVRWFTLVVIVVFFADLVGWISLQEMLKCLITI